LIGALLAEFLQTVATLIVGRALGTGALAAGRERFAATIGRVFAHRIVLVLGKIAIALVTTLGHQAAPLRFLLMPAVAGMLVASAAVAIVFIVLLLIAADVILAVLVEIALFLVIAHCTPPDHSFNVQAARRVSRQEQPAGMPFH